MARTQPSLMSPAQCRAARAWIGFTQVELCQIGETGIAYSTLKEFEGNLRRSHTSSIRAIQQVFERAGVTFHFDENGKARGISVAPTQWLRENIAYLSARRQQLAQKHGES